MPIKYIGRTTTFKGKPLWEILGNLKNYGVGRLIIRNKFQRYPEPTYIKILKAAALPAPLNPTPHDARLVTVLIESVFRGRPYPRLLQITGSTYKDDFMLVPKDQEHYYLSRTEKRKESILPKTAEFPPLLRDIIIRQEKMKGLTPVEEPKLELIFCTDGIQFARVAREGEEPTVKVTVGLGTPVSPGLFENIQTKP